MLFILLLRSPFKKKFSTVKAKKKMYQNLNVSTIRFFGFPYKSDRKEYSCR